MDVLDSRSWSYFYFFFVLKVDSSMDGVSRILLPSIRFSWISFCSSRRPLSLIRRGLKEVLIERTKILFELGGRGLERELD